MANLYNILSDLCNQKGISGYRMCKDNGLQPSIMSDLKMGRRRGLSAENTSKIAEYFGVSVDYLLGNSDKKEKSPIEADEELNEYLEELRTRPDMRMLFSLAKGATAEDVKQAVKIIEALRKDDNE